MNSSEPLPQSPTSSSVTDPSITDPSITDLSITDSSQAEPSQSDEVRSDEARSVPLAGSQPAPESQSAVSGEDASGTIDPALMMSRQHPIPPPSEARQYRAIGLVRGQYTPSEEQFTRGTIVAADGTKLEAVLLGRVMSLVKKHLNLEESHLWVTYPRTRDREGDLHIQIVGVWEPEKLNRLVPEGLDTDESQDSQEGTIPALTKPDLQDGYFSIRGEVIFQAQEGGRVIIKIRQAPRKEADGEKAFKLLLQGTLPGKAVGYFWDLHVQRQDNALVIQEAHSIGIMPPRKKSAGDMRPKRRPMKPGVGRGGFRRSEGAGRPQVRTGEKPVVSGEKPLSSAAPVRKEPLPKPVKRRSDSENN